jgi:FAD/FMN-containing dehydrogenase
MKAGCLGTTCADKNVRFDPSLDDEIRAFSRTLLKKASETAASRSKDGGVGQYGNYARKFSSLIETLQVHVQDANFLTAADVEANDIFGANVKKLEDLKHRYDPDNLFSHGTRLTPRPLVVVN